MYKKDKIRFSEHTLFIGQAANVESKDGEFKIPLAYDYRKYTYQLNEVIEFNGNVNIKEIKLMRIWNLEVKIQNNQKPQRRPTFPTGLPASIMGAGGLNCRVRNGNRVFPHRHGHQGFGN